MSELGLINLVLGCILFILTTILNFLRLKVWLS